MAFHDEVDADAVAAMAEVFTEVVIAPSFTAAASAAFAERPNLRVVAAPLPDGPTGSTCVRCPAARSSRTATW